MFWLLVVGIVDYYLVKTYSWWWGLPLLGLGTVGILIYIKDKEKSAN